MKILMVNPLDVLYTPTTVRTLLHAKAFTRKGHGVTMVFFREPRRMKDQPVRTLDEITFPLVELNPFSPIQNILSLTRLLRQHDLLFLEKAFPYSVLPAVVAALLTGRPIHYDWTDLEQAFVAEVYRYPVWPWLVGLYEKVIPKIASSMTVASRHLEHLALTSGFDPTFLGWLPAGVDTDRFTKDLKSREAIRKKYNITHNEIVFLYLGGLEPGTYVDTLIKAASILKFELNFSLFRILVVGDGTWKSELEALTLKEKVAENVTFAGMISPSRVVDYLSASDVGLSPYADTIYVRGKSPLKLVEYLSCGLPILGSDVGDIKELVGPAGRVVRDLDATLFAREMKELATQPEQLSNFSNLAKQRARELYDYRNTSENALYVITKSVTAHR